jgi:transcriptional regulator with XRE-family HTH domain
MIFSREIRAGRALLGWSQVQLAKAASVGVATVRRLESADTEIRGSVETLWKVQKALEEAGIEFIPADELRGPGLRLKRSGSGKQKGRRRSRV